MLVKRQAFAADVLRRYPDFCPGILAIVKNGISTSSATKQFTTEKEFSVTPRRSIVIVFASLLPSIGIAQEDRSPLPKVGAPIVIGLTGKPAAAYLRLLNQPVPNVRDGGFCVPLEARIISIDHDDLIAECQIHIKNRPATDVEQLLTITVSFHRQQLVAPSIYRNPQPNAETERERLVQAIIARQESLPKVQKSSFEGITIRVWSLEKEIVE